MTRIWEDTRCDAANAEVRNKNAEVNASRAFILTSALEMPDPAEQLQRLYLAGFDLQTFDRFPKCVGVVRDNCIALVVPGTEGLQVLGTPGWRMGEVMGVLVEREGSKVFQAKENLIEATPERLETLRRCAQDLKAQLSSRSNL
jgi:hypothetical protein